MFGLFAPKCPLDTKNKTWVERRMLWLARRFGLDRVTATTDPELRRIVVGELLRQAR